MKAAEGKPGRVFALHLDAGEALAESVERFAAEHGILAAHVSVLARPAGGRGPGRLAIGVIALGEKGQATLALAGEADAAGGACAVVIQEWLGMRVLRAVDPRTGAVALEPENRAPGQTMVLRQAMLEQALARAAKCAPAPTPAPSAPSAAAPRAAPAVAPGIAAEPLRVEGPATAPVFLLGARVG